MSTPRQERRQYLSLPSLPTGNPIDEELLNQTLLQRAGVDDDELAELLRESITELRAQLQAKSYVVTTNARKESNVLEVTDNSSRLKAIDMLLKLTSSYPKATGKAARTPIVLNLPGYYEPPAADSK